MKVSRQGHTPAALSRPYVARRTRAMFIAVTVAFAICVGQLVRIQLVHGAELSREASSMRTVQSTVEAQRGNIVDKDGNVLATSVESYDIIANQKFVRQYIHREVHDRDGNVVTKKSEKANPGNKEVIVGTGAVEAARQMAPVLGMNRQELGGALVGNLGYRVVKKKVTPQVWRRIKEMNIDGIDGIPHYLRQYPNGSTAANIIGVTNDKNEGVAGIERQYNKQLTGKPGHRKVEISPSGQVIPGGTEEDKAAQPGGTVHLTIDSDLQHMAQETVQKTNERFKGEWTSAVVMEIGTGKILAMAQSDTSDPFTMRDKNSTIRIHAVEDPFEPGSTGKLVTFANALEDKVMKPTDVYTVPYEIVMPGNEKIKNSVPHPTKRLTAAGILAESANTGTVQIGSKIDRKRREQYMRKMGWGDITHIGLPAETKGLLTPAENWDQRQNYTVMFGQGVAVSQLQVVQMTAAIGNNGVLVAPRIVDSVTDASGNMTVPKQPKPRRVMSADNAATLLLMMEGVTQKGYSGYMGRVPGYRTAAKTGTSELFATKDSSAGVVASFTGVVPADQPKVAISVVCYKPQQGRYGGVVAGPVFAAIGSQIMTSMNIPPSSTPPKLYPPEEKDLNKH